MLDAHGKWHSHHICKIQLRAEVRLFCLQVVGQLRAKLADTTKGFQEVMTVRQDNLKAHQGRRQLFSALPDSTASRSRPSMF